MHKCFPGFPGGLAVKNVPAMREMQKARFSPQVGKLPWGKERQPTPVFSPRKSHEQRSLVGYS